ncbi:MAG: VOC family protein [Candidatus Nanoarchaeia archaeon]
MASEFLHTMIRVSNIEETKQFFSILGLKEMRRKEVPQGKFTLVFLATHEGAPEIELTYNWNSDEEYTNGRNFGHLAFRVENIYQTCEEFQNAGVTINRPPRDGHMAFVKTPDNISVELLQKGDALPEQEPWKSMENQGSW